MSALQTKHAKAATRAHVGIYRISQGKLAGKMGGNPLCLLTTTGRQSGVPRTTPLVCFTHEGDKVVVASNGGSERFPSWFHNVKAHPQVTLRLGAVSRPMTARVASASEKAEIWPQIVSSAPNFAGYQDKTDRDIPLVILSRA